MSDYENATLITAIFDPSITDEALYAPWALAAEPPPEAGKVSISDSAVRTKRKPRTRRRADSASHARESELQAAPSSAGGTANPPSWADIKQKQWSDIEARYEAGNRDKETVCAWMAYQAALGVCKGQPLKPSPTGDNDRFNELLMEGYQAAIRQWGAAHAPYVDPDTAPDEKARKAIKKANALRYDSTKDKGNGIPGLVYKAAEGRMRNAASELFTKHGKRKHSQDDVLPVVTDLVADRASHEAPEWSMPRTAAAYEADADDNASSGYVDGTDPDIGSIKDTAINAAAIAAERAKFNFDWTTRVHVPGGHSASKGKTDPTSIDRNAYRVSKERAEIRVQQLLSMLPNKDDRKLITQYWGLEGRADSLTIEELAEAMNKPEKIVRRRLDDLLIELKFLAPRRPRQSAWRQCAEGH